MGKVFFWTPDEGGSRQYRCAYPAEALKQRGHEVNTATTPCASWAKGATIYAQRPFSQPSIDRIRAMQQLGCRVVVDFDDDYLNVDPQADPAVYRHYLQPDKRQLVQRALREADAVCVPTPKLAALAYDYGARQAHAVPNGLPARFLNHKPLPDLPADRTVIGWAGTPSSAAEFELIVDPVRRFLSARRNPDDVVFRTVGVNPDWVFEQILDRGERPVMEHQVECIEWLEGHDDYMAACATFDIWLAPYRDVPFNGAKYPTKALEAAFLGVAIVASDILPYRDVLAGPDPRGHLIRQDYQWGRTLRNLVEDARRHQHLAVNALDWAVYQTTEHLAPLWERVLWPQNHPEGSR